MGKLMILKNDLRKRKGHVVIIFLLSFLITLLIVTTASVLWKCNEIYDEMAKKVKIPEVVNLYPQNQIGSGTEVYEKLQKQKEVKHVNLKSILLMPEGNSVKMQGNDWYPSQIFLRPFPKSYTLADGSRKKDGIYLPITFKSSGKLNVGDNVTLKFTDKKLDVPIAGFFEDPCFGGELVGAKQLFLEKDTFQTLYSKESAYHGRLLELWLNPHGGKRFSDVMKDLNKETNVANGGIMYVEASSLKMAVMFLCDILMGLIFLFGLMLFIILLITVRYILLSSMEDDYREIGVLHAIGYTKNSMIAVKILFLFLQAAAGGICGVLISALTIPVLGNFALNGTGILWHKGLNVLPIMLSVAAVFLLIMLVTWRSLRKIKRLSTVQAIRNGNEDVYFTKRFHLSLDKLCILPLPAQISMKNMSVRLGQFALLIIVCGFMVFSMVSISALDENMHDIKKMSFLFGGSAADISITDRAQKTDQAYDKFKSFIKDIKQLGNVKLVYSTDMKYMNIEGQKMLLTAVSRFTKDNYQKPLEGRVPKYDNEIMITEIVGEYLGKRIGDTIEIENEGSKKEYLITGFYQSTSDLGKVVCVTTQGMRRLVPDFEYNSCGVLLKNESDLQKTMGQIKKRAMSDGMNVKIENAAAQMDKTIKGVQTGLLAVALLFYLLAILMTGLITFLLAITLLRKQKREFSIQRSLGYSVTALRLQFACSFGLAGLLGAALGAAAVYLFTNKMFGALFRTIGITVFHAELTVGSIALPVIILSGFLSLFSFLISGRIKKVGMRQLVEDA